MTALLPLLAAAAALFAAAGGGAALLHRFAPRLLSGPAGWLFALGVGVAMHAALASAAAAVGVMSSVAAAAILLFLGGGWLLRPAVAQPRPSGGWAAALLPLLLLPAFIAAFAPPTDTDELYQHLNLARRIAEGGGLLGGFDTPDGSRPQLIHATLASLFALGGAEAARLWHLGLAMALLFGASELGDARFGAGRGLLPAAVLAGSYTFVHEAGLAYNDVPAALWLLLGVEAALGAEAAAVGLFLGLAVAAKYTALPAAAAGGLVLLARSEGARPRAFVMAAAAGLACLAPWWVRNAASGLHPLFPYAGWPAIEGFRFMYAEKYGVGHSWTDALLLPLNVLFKSGIATFAFFGRLSWGWLGLGLGALWVARRNRDARALLLVLLVGFVAWGSTAQVMRFLLPLAGVAVLLGAASGGRMLTFALLLMSLPENVAPLVDEAEEQWPAVAGLEDREVWRAREVPGWGAVAWLRDHAPPTERVALLFAWQGYYVQQPQVLGSVEDHTPTRQWLAQHGDASLRELRAQGVRWLLVGEVRFLRKSYTFLPEADFRRQFTEPAEQLRALLARDAVLTYGARHWEVWHLDDRPPGE